MTRIVLHIGMNKTGTKAIQSFFRMRSNAMRRHGLLYPRVGRGQRLQHLNLAYALGFSPGRKEGPAPVEERSRLRAKLDTEIAKYRAETVFISSEIFSRVRPLAPVAEFFEGYELKVVVYLRRHDFWWASRYAQAVKAVQDPPWEKGFEAFCEHSRGKRNLHQSYARLADCWAEVFGINNIVIRPYEAAQNKPDLVADMLHAIDAPDNVFKLNTDDTRRNRSVSAGGLEQIDEIQRSNLKSRKKQSRIKKIIKRDLQIADGLRGVDMIPPALRRQLVEENLEDYEYIARTYLGREDGRMFYDPLP